MDEAFIGTIIAWAGLWVPRNWALCDGRQLSTSENPALFAVIGVTYGGDGVRTFSLPNLTDTHENPIKYIICTQGMFPPHD